ncbi:MAG: ABC transporter ATP-binding protein [Paracoccaceae bacterium]|nr:ABC transporter ATP-binding protein [Paracoccaceae bacterium]
MTALLDIRSLNVDFRTPRGRVHALRDVSLQVPKGKIVGVVGESGSGKSTVIWTVTRLLAANGVVESGEAIFDGQDLLTYPEPRMQEVRGEKVSMVFQDPMTSQSPVLSYGQQMTDILYRRPEPDAEKMRRAVEMMRRVGIPDPESRIAQYPHQFSGGMRQRAGIAMALLMDPMLLVADEPTTALDVTMEAQIIHLIRELQREFEATIMVVSHNLGLIAELCDEVVVMYAGEVVEHGDVRDIFYRAAHPYTRALLECDPAREMTRTRLLPVIPGDIPDLHIKPTGCVFAPRCPKAMVVCRERQPDAHTLEGGHATRCHLLDPGLAEGPVAQAEHTAPEAVSEGPRSSGAPLLEVDHLSVRFRIMGALKARVKGVQEPFVDAVLNASLTLKRGETLGLVGESGSGKTTLGRAVLGLAEAHLGNVTFEGRDVLGLSPAAFKPLRRDMAMMFQDPVGSLSPRQTVRALVTEPFEIHGLSKGRLDEEAERLCDMVRLPLNFLSRYPHELSGGQARRVGVARALALNPKLIIADEPTAGLDVSVQGEILNLMGELQREHGLGYLIISHNLPVVRHISDKLAIMYLGRLVERGDSEAIFARPAHPYTEALVGGVPQPDPDKRRALVSIEGEVPSLASRPSGCEFHTRCKYATERCRAERPGDTVLGDGRIVTCHHPLTD